VNGSKLAFIVWTCATSIWAAASLAHSLGLRVNNTSSLPIGLWRITPPVGPLPRGSIVSFYARYQALFAGPRWEDLALAGAKTQRLLWASTGTKNPAHKDTLYVETLVGRDTVNTMPPATLDAVRDHGIITPDAIEQDVDGARHVLAAVEEHGIGLDDIMDKLVVDGVKLFSDAFDKLLAAIVAQRHKLAG
jgi:hypothetical protein